MAHKLLPLVVLTLVSAAACNVAPEHSKLSKSLAFDIDADQDGVADEDDNCPLRPNAADANGGQPLVCRSGLAAAIESYVFLGSRTFEPNNGVDPTLAPVGDPLRVFLHLEPTDSPVVLSAADRATLAAAGVVLFDYVPHRTYYALVPGTAAELHSLAALSFVQGISAIIPEDRIAVQIRGTESSVDGPDEDGLHEFSVTFFDDVDATDIEAAISAAGGTMSELDETEAVVEITYADLLTLAADEGVYWIDDVPGGTNGVDGTVANKTVEADVAVDVLGLEGDGLTIGMSESFLADQTHPDLLGRIIVGSTGSFAENADDAHSLSVASIIAGDGSIHPLGDTRGVLPKAQVVTMAGSLKSARKFGYRQPRDARTEWDAVAFNTSWSQSKCRLLGRYRSVDRQFDRAGYRHGLPIVQSSGNHRDRPVNPCAQYAPSLGRTAKNSTIVGNWHMAERALQSSSSIGPTNDGRLKPDIVAPGQGVLAAFMTYPTPTDANPDPAPIPAFGGFGGTSGAAPVVTGVVGQIMETFRDDAATLRDPLDIPPATIKAILVHTSKDVGPKGPDHMHGFGLVQAAPAVRIARDNDDYVREDTVTASAPAATMTFEVTSKIYSYKVTLAWDDKHGTESSTLALINDLDLTVTSPGGQAYFPFDTSIDALGGAARQAEIESGAKSCNSQTCQDRRNNVEQVVVSNGGASLPMGTWIIAVAANRLETSDQDFSVVLSPECPIRIASSVTLEENVECPYEALEPEAIILDADHAAVDCAGYEVIGEGHDSAGNDGRYIGISTNRLNASATGCEVSGFDIGFLWEDATGGAIIDGVARAVGSAGYRLSGTGTQLRISKVRDMLRNSGVGVDISGSGHIVSGNDIRPSIPSGVRADGMLVRPAASGTSGGHQLTLNVIAEAGDGLVMRGDLEGTFVSDNSIGNLSETGIWLDDADNIVLVENEVEGYGDFNAGVWILRGENNELRHNVVYGTMPGQIGIHLESDTTLDNNAERHRVWQNRVEGMGTGLREFRGARNQLWANVVRASTLGIDVEDCQLAFNYHIQANHILGGSRGIDIRGDRARVVLNQIFEVTDAGIEVVDSPGDNPVLISDNVIRPHLNSFHGIRAAAVAKTQILRNDIDRTAVCLHLFETDRVEVQGNYLKRCGDVALNMIGNESTEVRTNNLVEVFDVGVYVRSGKADEIFRQRFIDPDGEIAIRIGRNPTVGAGEVNNVTVRNQRVTTGFVTALSLGGTISSATIVDSIFEGSSYGVLAESLDGADLTIEGNRFRGGLLDGSSVDSLDTRGNDWSEAALMDLIDGDGDGLADCGTDHVFSSVGYAGPTLNTARTSTKTEQVSDEAAQTTTAGFCP